MSTRALLLTIALFAAAACQPTHRPANVDEFKAAAKPGMNSIELVTVVGQPIYKDPNGRLWTFNVGGQDIQVTFDSKGLVTGTQDPSANGGSESN